MWSDIQKPSDISIDSEGIPLGAWPLGRFTWGHLYGPHRASECGQVHPPAIGTSGSSGSDIQLNMEEIHGRYDL
jgi:hypothetical protein